MKYEIITRAEWGARYGNGSAGRRLRDEVIIHTEAGAPLPEGGLSRNAFMAKVRAIERVAISRGFNGISYTHLFDPIAGWIAEGRGWGQDGAHTVGHNTDGYALCFVGHGDKQAVGVAGWSAAQDVIRHGIKVGMIAPRYRLSGHRDNLGAGTPAGVGRRLAYKSCPGDLIYPHIGRLRGLTANTPTPKEWDDTVTEAEFRKVLREELSASNEVFLAESDGKQWVIRTDDGQAVHIKTGEDFDRLRKAFPHKGSMILAGYERVT